MKIKILVHIFVVSVAIFVVAFVQKSSQFAQQKTEKPIVFRSLQGENLSEFTVYEHLFRMVNSYNQRADRQELLGFSQRAIALQTHFQRKLQLNNEQVRQLNKIADSFQQEVTSLKESKGKIEDSVKAEPDETNYLIELKDVYEKRGQLWSKYRDSLRETFGSEKFEQFQQLLQESIAAKIKREPVAAKQHPRLTAQKSPDFFAVESFSNSSFSDVSYDSDTNQVYGVSVTWIEGNGGGGPYFSEFNIVAGGGCDPEENYCWNVSIGATMEEPEGTGTPQSGYGCDGFVEADFYPEYEIESGDYCVYGDHAGELNGGPNPSCSIQGGDVSSSSDDCVTVTLPKIDILLNGNVVTNSTQNVIVGQQISLSAQVTNGTPTNPQWTIPGNKVANYVITYTDENSPSTAIVTELTSQNLTQPTTNFYWVDGGDSRQVQYSVRINNRTYTATATFNVKSPTVTVTTQTNETTIYTNRQHQELLFGELGIFGGGKFGITFTRSDFQLPTGFSGNTIWVQVIDYSYKGTLTDGQTTKTASGIGLDARFPYSSADPNANETRDLPGVCLRACDSTIPSFAKMEARIDANMWLMFKPSNLPNGVNSIYVPLKKVSWNWTATATRGTDFLFYLPKRCCSNSKNPSGESPTSFPQWNVIVTGKEPYQ